MIFKCFTSIGEISLARQLNVQQQNEIVFSQMIRTAKYYRQYGVASGISNFFESHGIATERAVFVEVVVDGWMMGFQYGFGGLLVTGDARLYAFELETDLSLNIIKYVHEFEDVTDQMNLSTQNKGVGKSRGAIAIEVLRELNRDS